MKFNLKFLLVATTALGAFAAVIPDNGMPTGCVTEIPAGGDPSKVCLSTYTNSSGALSLIICI